MAEQSIVDLAPKGNCMKPAYELFVANYLKTGNASAAARAAGYSEKGASVQGTRLLRQPSIAAALAAHAAKSEKKQERAVAQAELTFERVMQELMAIVLFDPATMYDEDGKLLPVSKMPEQTRRALSAIEENPSFTKLKAVSKLGGIELASKLAGWLKAERENTQAVQIIIAPGPKQPEVTVNSTQILPEWE